MWEQPVQEAKVIGAENLIHWYTLSFSSLSCLIRLFIIRGWRLVVQTAVRPFFIVHSAPTISNDLCLAERVEQLGVEQFPAIGCNETFSCSVLSRFPWIDELHEDAVLLRPALNNKCDKLAAVVRADVVGHPMLGHHNIEVPLNIHALLNEGSTGDPRKRRMLHP